VNNSLAVAQGTMQCCIGHHVLLVNNTNIHSVLHSFHVIMQYCSNFHFWAVVWL